MTDDAPLFNDLPVFPVALPADELRLLAILPDWPATAEVDHYAGEHAAARRLEARGLIKISREKMDPDVSDFRTWFAGKLPASGVRTADHG